MSERRVVAAAIANRSANILSGLKAGCKNYMRVRSAVVGEDRTMNPTATATATTWAVSAVAIIASAITISGLTMYWIIIMSRNSKASKKTTRGSSTSSTIRLPINWPVVGMLPALLANAHDLYDWITALIERGGGSFRFAGPWMMPSVHYYATADPRNVEHVLRSRFGEYPKGPDFVSRFHDLLGDGIFNADGDRWRELRKASSLQLRSREFKRHADAAIAAAAAAKLLPILRRFCAESRAFDLQDLMLRFTFDTVCIVGFGADTGCLSEELPDVPFAAAFEHALDCTTFRFLLPDACWRALKILGIGTERRMPASIRAVDRFLADVIAHRRREIERLDRTRAPPPPKADLLSCFMRLGHRGSAHLADIANVANNIVNANANVANANIANIAYANAANANPNPNIVNADIAYTNANANIVNANANANAIIVNANADAADANANAIIVNANANIVNANANAANANAKPNIVLNGNIAHIANIANANASKRDETTDNTDNIDNLNDVDNINSNNTDDIDGIYNLNGIDNIGSDNIDGIKKRYDARDIGDDEKLLRDMSINFLIAGRDTSALALSWFFWLVARHPEVDEKLAQEAERVMGSGRCRNQSAAADGAAIAASCESLGEMIYLHAALNESLRLYPPLPIDIKHAAEDDVLPDGYKVKKGHKVLYSIYSMGRMESIWGPDYASFRPERWLNVNAAGGVELRRDVSAFRFAAFNAGPRTCLGKDMAYVLMKSVASTLLFHFRVKLVPAHNVLPKLSVTLYMKHGLLVTLEPRR